jgi:peroxiredoxin
VQTGNGGKARLGALLPVAVAVAAAVGIVVGYTYLHAPRATRVHAGEMAPDFTLPSIVPGDPPVRLSGRRGGPTLLVLFDSRAPGNDAYFLNLQRLHAKYVRSGLSVISVAVDPTAAALPTFADHSGVTFTILTDPFAAVLHTAYGTPRDPEAYLIDREGRVVAVYTQRIDPDTYEFQRLIKQLLGLPGR